MRNMAGSFETFKMRSWSALAWRYGLQIDTSTVALKRFMKPSPKADSQIERRNATQAGSFEAFKMIS